MLPKNIKAATSQAVTSKIVALQDSLAATWNSDVFDKLRDIHNKSIDSL